jgi:hypothetical protein
MISQKDDRFKPSSYWLGSRIILFCLTLYFLWLNYTTFTRGGKWIPDKYLISNWNTLYWRFFISTHTEIFFYTKGITFENNLINFLAHYYRELSNISAYLREHSVESQREENVRNANPTQKPDWSRQWQNNCPNLFHLSCCGLQMMQINQ